MTSSVRIHVLGLGLSYDDAYTLARSKGVPERYLDTHDVDDALNTHFTRRGHATACIELLPHERPDGTDFDYCIITNFRVVSRHHLSRSAWNIFDERPCADEWTARVSEALLPGADYQSMLMRMTLEDWAAAPAFIERFYKHQSSGKRMIQASGISPDQTDYRPILTDRVRLQSMNKQSLARDAEPIPTKTHTIPTSPATIPTRSAHLPKLRIQTQMTKPSTAPLDGCESDEGYFSDMIVRG